MECKLHNRDIYTERQSCHARTPRVLTHPRQEIIQSIHYFPDSTLSSVGGVGGESIIGAAGGSVGGVVGASAGSTGVEFEEVELSLRRAPRRVRLPPGRIS